MSVTAMSRYVSTALVAFTRPVEFADRLTGRLERERSKRLPAPSLVPTHTDHLAAAHELAGAGPCDECARVLPEVRAGVAARLPGRDGQDAGMALAEMLWVLVRHVRPERVVETGVARGISSAFVLDALTRNGTGHLWSIDLPLLGRQWKGLVGCAVDPALHGRWTYVRGASRRKLPSLLASLGSIGMFVHDGLHTGACQAFEYRAAWAHLEQAGIVASDDVDFSDSFPLFAESVGRPAVLAAEPAKGGVVGFLRKSAQ